MRVREKGTLINKGQMHGQQIKIPFAVFSIGELVMKAWA